MASSQLFIDGFRKSARTFTPAHTTKAFVLWKPGNKGSRLHAISATNSDTANPVMFNLAWARLLYTTVASTGVVTISGGNTLTLSGGASFLANPDVAELLGGEQLVVLDATTANNRGSFGRITAVPTATTLTFPASTFPTPEPLPAGARIALVTQALTVNVRAGAGYAKDVSAHNLLTQSQQEHLASQPDNNEVMDGNMLLIGWCNGTLGAGKYLNVLTSGADY